MHYYNDNDPFIADWLRQLIQAGQLPAGEVDERDIADVAPADLRSFRQCHFFCGIAGWPVALDLAGWPEDRQVWTGSCPCQPISVAGRREGHADRRHVWPAFHDLIAVCQPATVFGEQVAGTVGREWFAAVRHDLERLGYACWASDIPAASVGAPHYRRRIYWLADAPGKRRPIVEPGRLYDEQSCRPDVARRRQIDGPWKDADWIYCRDGKWRPLKSGLKPLADGIPGSMGRLRGYGNAIVPQVAAEVIGAYLDLIEGE